jgi:hypothetical protein
MSCASKQGIITRFVGGRARYIANVVPSADLHIKDEFKEQALHEALQLESNGVRYMSLSRGFKTDQIMMGLQMFRLVYLSIVSAMRSVKKSRMVFATKSVNSVTNSVILIMYWPSLHSPNAFETYVIGTSCDIFS